MRRSYLWQPRLQPQRLRRRPALLLLLLRLLSQRLRRRALADCYANADTNAHTITFVERIGDR